MINKIILSLRLTFRSDTSDYLLGQSFLKLQSFSGSLALPGKTSYINDNSFFQGAKGEKV